MSFFDLTKPGGDFQGRNYEGDRMIADDLTSITRRFESSYYEDVDVGNITATLSATNVKKGILKTTPAANIVLTSPTAALLVAEDPKYRAVGRGYEFTIVNLGGANTATLGAGVGVTLVGNATVAALSSGRFYLRYTNVTADAETVTIIRIA